MGNGQNAVDAARYRFIRDADRSDAFVDYETPFSPSGESLDEAIDAAIREERSRK